MSSLTSIDILGGLGNHLFMIAFILHYARKSRKDIVFKYEKDLYNTYDLPRKTFWNTLFKDQFKVLPKEEYDSIPFDLYHEYSDFLYRDVPIFAGNVRFTGYYQSFKYIDDDIRQQMINCVYSNADLMYEAYELYNKIKEFFNNAEDDDMVSMHIRRTDYINSSNYHYNLQKDYYEQALKIANKKKVVVFSDDINWCKAMIDKSWYDYEDIYFVDINSVEIEFILMSLFQHNIIANSTFSLWASFISTYDQPKIIIAPKKWLTDKVGKDWSQVYHKYITHFV